MTHTGSGGSATVAFTSGIGTVPNYVTVPTESEVQSLREQARNGSKTGLHRALSRLQIRLRSQGYAPGSRVALHSYPFAQFPGVTKPDQAGIRLVSTNALDLSGLTNGETPRLQVSAGPGAPLRQTRSIPVDAKPILQAAENASQSRQATNQAPGLGNGSGLGLAAIAALLLLGGT